MQCPVPEGCADFTCYGQGGTQSKSNPDTEVWINDIDTTKKGLLGTSSAANDSKTYMDFATLNDATRRNTWLNNAYTALRTTGDIPPPPTNSDIDNIVHGNLHGTPPLTTYMTDVAAFQTRIQKEL